MKGKRKCTISIIIILLILIIITIFCICKKNSNKDVLGGEKINDYLYKYNIENLNFSSGQLLIQDGLIYFLYLDYKAPVLEDNKSDETSSLILETFDIYNNKNIKKSIELKKYDNYELKTVGNDINILIYESDNKKTSIKTYNRDLEKVKEYEIDKLVFDIYPYEDSFIYSSDNSILKYNADTKQSTELYKSPDFCNNFLNGFSINNNMYMQFFSQDLNCVYNVSNNTTSYLEGSFVKYENGYYSIENQMIVYNYAGEKKIYNKLPLNDTEKFVNALSKDGNTFVSYDGKGINVYNLENQTIDFKIDITNAEQVFVYDNYIYIFDYQKNELYILDLSKIERKPITVDREDLLIQKIDNLEKIEKLEKKYNINIITGEDAIRYFPSFYAISDSNISDINHALNELEVILSKFTKEVFDDFYSNNKNGLNIYLTGNLGPSDLETQISNPAGYSLIYKNEAMIVLDITQSSLKQNVCHELMHSLERNTSNYSIFDDISWNSLNPKNYSYQYSYTDDVKADHVIGSEDEVYFVDYYSHTFPLEDRARIFENICSVEKDSIINDYPNLVNKAKYIKKVLEQRYPSLKNTNLFESLNF